MIALLYVYCAIVLLLSWSERPIVKRWPRMRRFYQVTAHV